MRAASPPFSKQETLLPTRPVSESVSSTCFLYFYSLYSKSKSQLTPPLPGHVHGRGTACLRRKRAEGSSLKALASPADSSEVDRLPTSGSGLAASGLTVPV